MEILLILVLLLVWRFSRGGCFLWMEPSYGMPQVVPHDAIRLKAAVGGFVEVVGESHYQLNIRRAKGAASRVQHWHEFWARLEHEPTNRVDPNAVRVMFKTLTLGYLKRDEAKEFLRSHREALRSNRPIFCEARILGGTWGKPSYGVFLDFWLDSEERHGLGLDEQGHGRRGA